MTILRVAICNLQTGIATTRGYWHYLTTCQKFYWPHDSCGLTPAARFLRSHDIDIAALCELDCGSTRTRGANQLSLLALNAGFEQQAFFPTCVRGARVNQGNAICARFPLRTVNNHRLPGSGEPRFLSEAIVDIEDITIRFFVTHLSLNYKVRVVQLHSIIEIVNRETGPTILAGDFNAMKENELDLFDEGILRKVTSVKTFPSWRPTRCLDQLFISEHFTLIKTYVFNEYLFSDHLPLIAEISIKNTQNLIVNESGLSR